MYAGRLSWEKNLAMLHAAVDRAGGARLWTVTGHAWSAMPPYYGQAAVFALPSLSEGSPKALYEAMACGVPVLVTNAIEDRPPEDTATFLDPHDVEAWTQAIRTTLHGEAVATQKAANAAQATMAIEYSGRSTPGGR
jgi:glycosyltransferase involved in cell wall biosynthesis